LARDGLCARPRVSAQPRRSRMLAHLTVAVLLRLSLADVPTRMHIAMARCQRTCNRCTHKRVPAGAVQMTGQTSGSSVHVRVPWWWACPHGLMWSWLHPRAHASITCQCVSFVHAHVQTCMRGLAQHRRADIRPCQNLRGCSSLPLPPPLKPAVPTATVDALALKMVSVSPDTNTKYQRKQNCSRNRTKY